jgi:hypothetical protein
MDIKEIKWEDVDWILLAEDGDQWRVVMNTVMNHRISTKSWEILEWLKDGYCLKGRLFSMELVACC